jgi:hypothetical protein
MEEADKEQTTRFWDKFLDADDDDDDGLEKMNGFIFLKNIRDVSKQLPTEEEYRNSLERVPAAPVAPEEAEEEEEDEDEEEDEEEEEEEEGNGEN